MTFLFVQDEPAEPGGVECGEDFQKKFLI
jgi:hypothetical protein